MNGKLGDCAWGSPFGYWNKPYGFLAMEGASHARLVASEASYRAACSSRECLSVVDRPVISDQMFLMYGFLGLDNRMLLPPVCPVQRGQDLIFGAMITRSFPDSFVAHLPWALVHAPPENRRYWPGEVVRAASGIDFCRMMLECINSFEQLPQQENSEDRLRALGQHLMELSSQSLGEFEQCVRNQLDRSNKIFVSWLEGRLREERELPEYWANDVKRYLDVLHESVKRSDYCCPLDLVDGRGTMEARNLARRLVFRFGQLVYWWPDVVSVALELRAKGFRLANPL